jgi:hypothetical protein
VAVPRDGGTHDIEAVAPGKKTWTSHVELKRGGQTLEVDVPPLEDAPAPVAASQPPATPVGPEAPQASAASTTALEPAPERAGTTQRTIGWVIGGIGVAGVVLGAIAGVDAASTFSNAKQQCGTHAPACPAGSSGFAVEHSASNWATVSTIGFAAGGAMLGGAIILLFTAPKGESEKALRVEPATVGAGLSVRGAL